MSKRNLSSKKTNMANNRPNCLKVTKKAQKVNIQNITINGKKSKMSVREIRAALKNAA